jgi:DNA-binding transcriptional LysR family regulator
VASFLLPSAIAGFQARHPGIRFHVREAGSREIAADVSAGELDIGIVTRPVPARDLDIDDLFVDEIVLVTRSDHPFTGQRVSARDLDGRSFVGFESGTAIRQIIDRALWAAGVRVEVVMELRSIPSILKMVATTGVLAFVSSVSLESEADLRAVPVRGLSISRTLGLATRRGVPLSTPAAAFAAQLQRLNMT